MRNSGRELTLRKKWFICVALLIIAGGIRVGVAHYLPNDGPGDGRVYAQIARNVLEQHVYSHADQPPYEPSLIRLPGYPLFLASIYAIFGHTNNGAVRIVQALVDAGTCALVALLAFYWQPDAKRKFPTAVATLVLAGVSPFTMIYAATILTEVPTTFLAVAMAVAATMAFQKGDSVTSVSPWLILSKNKFTTEAQRAQRKELKRLLVWWCIAGFLGGLAVLLRPDSGLFAAAIGVTLVVNEVARIWSAPAKRSGDGALVRSPGFRQTLSAYKIRLKAEVQTSFLRFFIAGAVFSLAFVLVLAPWTIRNARVFHLFQPLAPAHGEMPGEFVPRGYEMWLRTWLDDEVYIGPFLWSLDSESIDFDDIPSKAFDSEDEKNRVAALFEKYNNPPDTESPNNAEEQKPEASPTPESKAGNEGDQAGKSEQTEESDEADESAQPSEPESVEMTPDIDAGFRQIARERIARHPVRYYLWLPIKRAGTMWINTHSQYWPWDGELFPLDDLDYDSHQQYWLPLFAGLTLIYTLLGLAGGWVLWRSRKSEAHRWLLLVALTIFLRLAFFSTIENPEPRYVVEFFPFLAALGGIFIGRVIPIASVPVAPSQE
jgi:hypothetical protein